MRAPPGPAAARDVTVLPRTISGSLRSSAQVLATSARHSREVGLTLLAGNLAFRLSLATFPSLIAVLWILRAIHADELARATSEIVGTVVPGVAHEPLREQLGQSPANGPSRNLTFGVAASFAIAVWAVSEVIRATISSLNAISGVEERRGALERFALTTAGAIATIALFVLATAVVASGARMTATFAHAVGLSPGYDWLWRGTTWLVSLVCVWAAFTLTYEVGPAKDQPFRLVRIGSVLGVCLWAVFAALFALYTNHLARPQQTYGALAGVAFLMIYSYGSAFALLIGAELNRSKVTIQHSPQIPLPTREASGPERPARFLAADACCSQPRRSSSK